jgi:hypothetical protein
MGPFTALMTVDHAAEAPAAKRSFFRTTGTWLVSLTERCAASFRSPTARSAGRDG